MNHFYRYKLSPSWKYPFRCWHCIIYTFLHVIAELNWSLNKAIETCQVFLPLWPIFVCISWVYAWLMSFDTISCLYLDCIYQRIYCNIFQSANLLIDMIYWAIIIFVQPQDGLDLNWVVVVQETSIWLCLVLVDLINS